MRSVTCGLHEADPLALALVEREDLGARLGLDLPEVAEHLVQLLSELQVPAVHPAGARGRARWLRRGAESRARAPGKDRGTARPTRRRCRRPARRGSAGSASSRTSGGRTRRTRRRARCMRAPRAAPAEASTSSGRAPSGPGATGTCRRDSGVLAPVADHEAGARRLDDLECSSERELLRHLHGGLVEPLRRERPDHVAERAVALLEAIGAGLSERLVVLDERPRLREDPLELLVRDPDGRAVEVACPYAGGLGHLLERLRPFLVLDPPCERPAGSAGCSRLMLRGVGSCLGVGRLVNGQRDGRSTPLRSYSSTRKAHPRRAGRGVQIRCRASALPALVWPVLRQVAESPWRSATTTRSLA